RAHMRASRRRDRSRTGHGPAGKVESAGQVYSYLSADFGRTLVRSGWWWRNGCKGGSEMSDPFIDTYSALEARMKIVDVITNTLANVNTTGFKRDFGLILQNETGVDAGTQVDTSSGDLVPTGNALDVALNG